MYVLVTYDVATGSREGRKRLRHVAKTCLDYGQRVQNSSFECKVNPAQWAELRHKLLQTYKDGEDSLRFYYLGKNWQRRVEHHGVKPGFDPDEPLIV